jgi:hypothetical protein
MFVSLYVGGCCSFVKAELLVRAFQENFVDKVAAAWKRRINPSMVVVMGTGSR